MYMDLDEDGDEERWSFQWEDIEGSESYILLDDLGYDYEEDDYDTGQYAAVVKHLQKISPNIRWRITFNGTDREGADPSQWRVICVPDYQLYEAQQVFDRFLEGDGFSDFTNTNK